MSDEDSTTRSSHATGALLTTQHFADISKRTLIGDFMLYSFIGQPQIALICHQSRPLTIGSEKMLSQRSQWEPLPHPAVTWVISVTQLWLWEGQGLAKDLSTCLRLSTRTALVKLSTFISDFLELGWTLQLLGIFADGICINKRIVSRTSISWVLHGRERWREEKPRRKVGC